MILTNYFYIKILKQMQYVLSAFFIFTIYGQAIAKSEKGIPHNGLAVKQWVDQHFAKGKTRGAQIDLVIDRADNCINLCEIKFCNDEYKMIKAYAEDLERKKKVFQEVTGTHKTIFLTLITPFGVKQNTHSIGIIDQQLTMNSLFDTPERRQ